MTVKRENRHDRKRRARGAPDIAPGPAAPTPDYEWDEDDRPWWISWELWPVYLAGLGLVLTAAAIFVSGDWRDRDAVTADAPAALVDGECFDSSTDAAVALRASVVTDISLSSRSRSVLVSGTVYIATPFGTDVALIGGYPEGDPSSMVAVNGLARSHTDLPDGGGQAGIDAALGCL